MRHGCKWRQVTVFLTFIVIYPFVHICLFSRSSLLVTPFLLFRHLNACLPFSPCVISFSSVTYLYPSFLFSHTIIYPCVHISLLFHSSASVFPYIPSLTVTRLFVHYSLLIHLPLPVSHVHPNTHCIARPLTHSPTLACHFLTRYLTHVNFFLWVCVCMCVSGGIVDHI